MLLQEAMSFTGIPNSFHKGNLALEGDTEENPQPDACNCTK